ncbi:hypothetical protein B7463_g5547, partial [Scytalidium lignicola]
MSNPNDYTVGWISATVTEYVAAQAFLDEEHEGPEFVSTNDHNDYTLGKVGKHNVVIAVLPQGEYGISSATAAIKDMSSSFPNVRIGLMVGIGGGAPSPKHDIRLGDVVVSAAGNGKGGIFQYDFGIATQGQEFQEKQFLNQPPVVLRTAVNGLMAQYKRKGHQFEETINSILENNRRMQKEYKRPDLSSDKLYKSDIIHPPNCEKSCTEVCGDEEFKLVLRNPRTEDEDDPRIHYGLVASANRLMEDALLRDKFAKDKDVLCFEMEAAGLMNQFPCLVIRGICDYSDSHRNWGWQGYAAMVAAAYAKDLLYRILPNKVEAEKKIIDIFSNVAEDVANIRSATVKTKNVVDRLDLDSQSNKINNWLRPPDPSTNFNKATKERHKGTGSWFLESKQFKEWKSGTRRYLWLHGIPGCGKTVLCSTIIENIHQTQDSSCVVVYFFFDFKDADKQSLEKMIRALIAQLYSKCGNAQKELKALFSSCDEGRKQPTQESLCITFQHMMKHIEKIKIVIDALDECTTRGDLLLWMKEFSNVNGVKSNILVTSRDEEDIRSGLELWLYQANFVPVQRNSVHSDIRAYVQKTLRENGDFERWHSTPSIQNEIETEIMKKADGMFRWAACQLDSLKGCLHLKALRKALASLPKTLDETYSRILANINHSEEHREDAIRILQFLTFSERPLTIGAVVDAIAVNLSGDLQFDPSYRMPIPREILRICSSLVSLATEELNDKTKGVIELELAHFSVKEYLISGRVEESFRESMTEICAQGSITRVCLSYLSHLDNRCPVEKINAEFPLAGYSVQYWMNHARSAETDIYVRKRILKFFLQQKQAYEMWGKLFGTDQPWRAELAQLKDIETPLYYASLAGLEQTVESLIEEGEDIVEILLNAGADVNKEGGIYYNTALQSASGEGHEKIVKLLLNAGADVNKEDYVFGNALRYGSVKGHDKIVEILLNAGADVNKESGIYYNTALQSASGEGHEKIVKLLLNAGADVNKEDNVFGNALRYASERGHDKIGQWPLPRDLRLPGQRYQLRDEFVRVVWLPTDWHATPVADYGQDVVEGLHARQTGEDWGDGSSPGHAGVFVRSQQRRIVKGGPPLNANMEDAIEAREEKHGWATPRMEDQVRRIPVKVQHIYAWVEPHTEWPPMWRQVESLAHGYGSRFLADGSDCGGPVVDVKSEWHIEAGVFDLLEVKDATWRKMATAKSRSAKERILAAANQRESLLQTIAATQHAVSTLSQTKIDLEAIKANWYAADERCGILAVAVEGEKAEWEELKGKNDYTEAMEWLEKARASRDVLKEQVDKMKGKRDALENMAKEHVEAQIALDALYSSVFDGPTPDHRQEDELEETVLVAQKAYDSIQGRLTHASHVVNAVSTAHMCLNYAIKSAGYALEVSNTDIANRRVTASLRSINNFSSAHADWAERDSLQWAQRTLTEAEHFMAVAHQLDPRVQGFRTPKVADGNSSVAGILDQAVDNPVTDYMFHREIQATLDGLAEAAMIVDIELKRAEERMAIIEDEMKPADAHLKGARHNLIVARAATFEKAIADDRGAAPPYEGPYVSDTTSPYDEVK